MHIDKSNNRFLISYPKAGRTWIRMMLLHYAGEEVVQAAHWLPGVAAKKINLKEAEVIYLMRDPRDMIVSMYFELTHRKRKFKGTLSQFIRDDKVGIKSIITHYNKWHAYKGSVKSWHEIWYEEFLEMPRTCLAELLGILGQNVHLPKVEKVVQDCAFDHMREMEKRGGGKLAAYKGHFGRHWKEGDPESFRCRKGKVGGYRDYMSPEDIEYCNKWIW